jgi:Flp pilus assembly secretin CpaC
MQAMMRWTGCVPAPVSLGLLLMLCAPVAFGDSDFTLKLHVNEARLMPLLSPAAHVFLDDPELAELNLVGPTRFTIVTRRAGHTVLHALGENGAVVATIDLDVEPGAAGAPPATDGQADLKAIEIALEPNATATLPLLAEASRVFVNDPTIAAVTMTGPEQLQVQGKSAGTTQVYALDDRGVGVGLFEIKVGGGANSSGPPPGEQPPPMSSEVTDAVQLEIDEARLIDLPRPASSATSDNQAIVGTRVQPPAKLLLYAKTAGQTFIRARDDSGALVAIVRVDVSPGMQ